MSKKIIPTSGARSSASDSSKYNKMDSYHEEEQRLRKQLKDLESDYNELEDAFYEKESQLKELIGNKSEYEKIISGRDGSVAQRDQKIADLEVTNKSLESSLFKHQDAIQLWSENADKITKELETEKQLSKGWRKQEQKLTLQVWGLAILGLAGTVWGSLGNPLPSFSGTDDDYFSPSGKTADQQIIDCIKDQKFGNDNKIKSNEDLPWLTEKTEFYLSFDKDKNHENILVSDLSYERLSNQTVIMEGVITNNTGSSITYISAQGYLVAPVKGTDHCRFIWSGFLIPKVRYNQKMNPIGNNSTQKFVLQGSLPENLSILEDAKWYFTDFSSY